MSNNAKTKKGINSRSLGFIAASVALFVLALLIGPMDFFAHGYFCDVIDMEMTAPDQGAPINLAEQEYTMTFSPAKRHFMGFAVYMTGQTIDDPGTFTAVIGDKNGNRVDAVEVPLSKMGSGIWYRVYTHASLQMGKEYTLKLSTHGSAGEPQLTTIDRDCLGKEVIDGNAALVFAYEKSTFPLETKVLLILLLTALWLAVAALYAGGGYNQDRKAGVGRCRSAYDGHGPLLEFHVLLV